MLLEKKDFCVTEFRIGIFSDLKKFNIIRIIDPNFIFAWMLRHRKFLKWSYGQIFLFFIFSERLRTFPNRKVRSSKTQTFIGIHFIKDHVTVLYSSLILKI